MGFINRTGQQAKPVSYIEERRGERGEEGER